VVHLVAEAAEAGEAVGVHKKHGRFHAFFFTLLADWPYGFKVRFIL
jgi:hypothetical protein